MAKQTDVKSDRLNDEVALFAGCTLNETMMVVLVSLIIGLVFGMPTVLLMSRSVTLGLAVSLVFMSTFFFPLLIKLSRLKRGKPSGYYQQYLKIQLSKIGIIKSPYVMASRKWSTRRVVK